MRTVWILLSVLLPHTTQDCFVLGTHVIPPECAKGPATCLQALKQGLDCIVLVALQAQLLRELAELIIHSVPRTPASNTTSTTPLLPTSGPPC